MKNNYFYQDYLDCVQKKQPRGYQTGGPTMAAELVRNKYHGPSLGSGTGGVFDAEMDGGKRTKPYQIQNMQYVNAKLVVRKGKVFADLNTDSFY